MSAVYLLSSSPTLCFIKRCNLACSTKEKKKRNTDLKLLYIFLYFTLTFPLENVLM